MRRFSPLFVAVTFLLQNFSRYSQSYPSVDAPFFNAFYKTLLRIVLMDSDFVTQKACCFTSRMGNERFGFRKLQLEFLVEEGSNFLFDFFCFFFRASEAEEKVVSVSTIS